MLFKIFDLVGCHFSVLVKQSSETCSSDQNGLVGIRTQASATLTRDLLLVLRIGLKVCGVGGYGGGERKLAHYSYPDRTAEFFDFTEKRKIKKSNNKKDNYVLSTA